MKIKGASEIMCPASVIVLDAIPLLGSGKTDYVALAKALREMGPEAPPASIGARHFQRRIVRFPNGLWQHFQPDF